jgi:hypothetical protein
MRPIRSLLLSMLLPVVVACAGDQDDPDPPTTSERAALDDVGSCATDADCEQGQSCEKAWNTPSEANSGVCRAAEAEPEPLACGPNSVCPNDLQCMDLNGSFLCVAVDDTPDEPGTQP